MQSDSATHSSALLAALDKATPRLVERARSAPVEGDYFEAVQTQDLNVLFVPDIAINSSLAWFGSESSWPKNLFCADAKRSRLIEFQYQVDVASKFSWARFIELGASLIDCMLETADDFQLRACPLLIMSHGLGGMLVKRAIGLLQERYYNPALQGILDAICGLVFFGTPHPVYSSPAQRNQLNMPLSCDLRLSKEALQKSSEDIAVAYTVSTKFEDVSLGFPVVSAYETVPTKMVSAPWTRSRREIIIDATNATTGVRTEQLIQVDADHRSICDPAPGSQLFESIKALAASAIESGVKSVVLSGGPGSDFWRSSPAVSRLGRNENRTGPTTGVASPGSPAGATAGSQDVLGFEVVTGKPGPVSETRAVKLPCYVLRQHSLAGECHDRVDVLALLDEKLLPGSNQNKDGTSLKAFALCGPGGMGKTQIATEFTLTRKHHFDAIFWVYAESESKLAAGFNTIAHELGLPEEMDSENFAVNRDLVVEWLTRPSKRSRGIDTEDEQPDPGAEANWLLVFDNADNPEILSAYWPISGTGSVLITSRDPLAKSRIYSSSGVDLEPFDPEISAEYLQNMTGNLGQRDNEFARQISYRLGGLPLALTQVSAILQRRDLSFEEFLEYYEEPSFLSDVHKTKVLSFRDSYERSLLEIWAFEHLDPDALRLLEILALMDPDRIAESIFLDFTGSLMLDDFPQHPLAFEKARTKLIQSSLIKRNKEAKEITVHRVIQDSVRARMSAKVFTACFKTMLDLLLFSWPTSTLTFSHETSRWDGCAKVLPHVERALDEYKRWQNPDLGSDYLHTFVQLLLGVGWYQEEVGDYLRARPFLEAARDFCNRDSSLVSDLVKVHFTLSSNGAWTRNWSVCRPHSEMGVALQLQLGGDTDRPSLAEAYLQLGRFHVLVHEPTIALEYLTKAIDINERLERSHDDPAITKSGRYLGSFPRISATFAYLALGRVTEANNVAERCLELAIKCFGYFNGDNFKTGLAMFALAAVRLAQERELEAFQLHTQTLEQYRLTLGNSHPFTAATMVAVAKHLLHRKDFQTAKTHVDDALKIWSDRHIYVPERARALDLLADIQLGLDNNLKAKGLRNKAVNMLKTFVEERNEALPTRKDGAPDFDWFVPPWAR